MYVRDYVLAGCLFNILIYFRRDTQNIAVDAAICTLIANGAFCTKSRSAIKTGCIKHKKCEKCLKTLDTDKNICYYVSVLCTGTNNAYLPI